MQKTAALQAYRRHFVKCALMHQGENWPDYMSPEEVDEILAYADYTPDIDSPDPMTRKRTYEGAGATLGSGVGLLGGALAGSHIPRGALRKILGGVGGGLGGLALGGLGGFGIGNLIARSRMGREFPKG